MVLNERRAAQELADLLASEVVHNIEHPTKLVHKSFDTNVTNELYTVTVIIEPKEGVE